MANDQATLDTITQLKSDLEAMKAMITAQTQRIDQLKLETGSQRAVISETAGGLSDTRTNVSNLAPLNSPVFTGDPSGPTRGEVVGNDTKLYTGADIVRSLALKMDTYGDAVSSLYGADKFTTTSSAFVQWTNFSFVQHFSSRLIFMECAPGAITDYASFVSMAWAVNSYSDSYIGLICGMALSEWIQNSGSSPSPFKIKCPASVSAVQVTVRSIGINYL